jgi:thymidylate synthase
MSKLNIVTGNSFMELYSKSNEVCKSTEIHNFIIDATLPINEIDCDFINSYTEDAQKWHNENRPTDLIINHGEYAHKFGDADAYVIRELKMKQFSNRACISLLNMENIINSKDAPIPSLFIVQFGFARENLNTIMVSIYYRSLEVSNFLKINFAEISLYLRKIKESFPNIEFFNLNIYAFRAQLIKDFHCLKKSEIDILTPIQLSYLIFSRDKRKIISLLLQKSTVEESLVNYESIETIQKSLTELDETPQPIMLLKAIKNVIEKKKKLKKLRENTSIFQNDIKPLSDEIRDAYSTLIQEFEKW